MPGMFTYARRGPPKFSVRTLLLIMIIIPTYSYLAAYLYDNFYLPYVRNHMIAKTLRPDTLVGARGLYFIPQLSSSEARAALLDMLARNRPLVELLPEGNTRSTPPVRTLLR